MEVGKRKVKKIRSQRNNTYMGKRREKRKKGITSKRGGRPKKF